MALLFSDHEDEIAIRDDRKSLLSTTSLLSDMVTAPKEVGADWNGEDGHGQLRIQNKIVGVIGKMVR